jgi:hypothetical protein
MHATQMPRPQSENTTQVAYKIPDAWVDRADALAAALSRPGFAPVTRTDILRNALGRGLAALEEERPQARVAKLEEPRASKQTRAKRG